jgi:hypothetical protein
MRYYERSPIPVQEHLVSLGHLRELIDVLSAFLVITLVVAYCFGAKGARFKRAHVSSHILALGITLIILLLVEFLFVPIVGRHMSLVFVFHALCLLGAAFLGYSAARIKLKEKKVKGQAPLYFSRILHARYGRPAIACWIAAAILGVILVHRA